MAPLRPQLIQLPPSTFKRLRDDIVRVGGRQEHRGAGVVLRHPHPAEGDGLADEALLLAERAVLVPGEQRVDLVPHRRVDDARRDAVDVDAVLDQVEPGRLRDRDHRRLAGAVDRHQGLAPPARPGSPC